MAVVPPQPSQQFHGRGVNLAVISIIFTSVAVALVAARLATRRKTYRGIGSDDCAILTSAIFSIGLTACNCVSTYFVTHGDRLIMRFLLNMEPGVENGIGKPIKTLHPHQIHKALQAFWVSQIVYKVTINMTKTSICLLYLRIFPNPRFRQVVHVVMTYVLMYAVASIVATVLQCLPLQRIWDRKVPGKCINLTAFWYANATANILGDVLILGLPMPLIKSLKLPRRQRWGLMLVFALGGFVCITSVLRMTTLKTGAKASDVTFGTLNSTLWTAVEANTAIVCACLPMLKSPLAALFPALFPRGSSASHGYGTGSGPYHRHSRSCKTPSRRFSNRNHAKGEQDTESTQGSTHMGIESPPPTGFPVDGKDELFRIKGENVPMGLIAKTTHVDVKVNGRKKGKPPSSTRRSSPSRLSTRSEAYLDWF